MSVLLIDDAQDILLMGKHCGCILADNAFDGYQMVESLRPRVVFCDYHGIESRGFSAENVIELCQSLGIRVILISSDERIIEQLVSKYGVESVSKGDLVPLLMTGA